MSKKIGNVEIFMGPHTLGSPDNLLDTIVSFIDGAKKSLNIAVQEIDSLEIAHAIIRAKQRKVRVRVVLEADYLRAKRMAKDPFKPSGSLEINRVIHDAILRANIRVNSDFNTNIFHQKFIIRDSTSVLTGSTNFTDTGVTKNFNHIVIINDKKVTKNFTKEFTEIKSGHFGKQNLGHNERPAEVIVSGLRIKTLFAPDHNPEMEIMKQIAKSKNRVDFAIFTFSESSGIDDELVSVSKRGVTVNGALYKSQANQKWSAKKTFKGSAANLYLVPKTNSPNPVPGKLHHKIMVIDESLVIVGSFNYTDNANLLNDENILIIGDLDTNNQTTITKQKDFAKYVLDDVDRIINIYGEAVIH
jgi:phosphatidylserine/phosphatidylglycerophosphate/cardiolipin synthase-like enzyme